ncbi:MAG: SDR family oxidoreductase [Deltaproteobacteria bacterium]|nr:SDR family oxidoreductase [Deltaproteobacteria bacterium]
MMNKKFALVTGASSGIGLEYARQLALDYGYSLILVARRENRLSELRINLLAELESKGIRNEQEIIVLPTDLLSDEQLDQLIYTIRERKIFVDLLVNNAGFGSLGSFLNTDLTNEFNMVNLNCCVPLKLMRKLLPKMREAKRGSVINICSTCSFQPMPYMATYGATKAFLFSLTMAIRAELLAQGLVVFAHCPGPTDSEFHTVVGLEKKISWLPGGNTKKVVAQALRAFHGGKPYCITGWLNKFLAVLSNCLSPTASSSIVKLLLAQYSSNKAPLRRSVGEDQ